MLQVRCSIKKSNQILVHLRNRTCERCERAIAKKRQSNRKSAHQTPMRKAESNAKDLGTIRCGWSSGAKKRCTCHSSCRQARAHGGNVLVQHITYLACSCACILHKNILQHHAAALMRPRRRPHTTCRSPAPAPPLLPWPHVVDHRQESVELAFHRKIQMEPPDVI